MGSHVIRPPFTSGINRFQTHHISVELEVNNWEVIGFKGLPGLGIDEVVRPGPVLIVRISKGSKGTDLFNQLIWIFKYLNKSVPFTHYAHRMSAGRRQKGCK